LYAQEKDKENFLFSLDYLFWHVFVHKTLALLS